MPEALRRPVPGEFGRQNPGMSILPTIVPDTGQLVKFCFFRCSYVHGFPSH
jgi:hypothetical protein